MPPLPDAPAPPPATFAALPAALPAFPPDFTAPPLDPNQLSAHLLQQIDQLAGADKVNPDRKRTRLNSSN